MRRKSLLSQFGPETSPREGSQFLYALKPLGALSFNLLTGANNANLIYLDLVGAIALLGAGKELWERLLALADGQRCHAVFLRSLPDAVDFWQRNGFKMWRGT